MSRYKRGDVVRAYVAYYDNNGILTSKKRPFVVIDVEDEAENISVACTTQLHQSKKYPGIIIKARSSEGLQMGLDEDSFIYCDKTFVLSNKDIIRKIGTCPLIDEIVSKLQ